LPLEEIAMMTLQARETFVPRFGTIHPLREYPLNSPRAKARLVLLALLADGRLDKREFASLENRGVYATLGLSREDFVAVLFDFCSDIARLPKGEGSYSLTPVTLAGLFAEVDNPVVRKQLMRHIFEIISSDGRLSDGEERLFWNAVDAWKLRSADSSSPRAADPPPGHYYG
jgi:hypothetical protein